MTVTKARHDERGVALILTIFGLLLLTAVVMAMLFSSDAETTIAVNYRDKEVANYAAMSGVQEARDRLQPQFGDLSGYKPVFGVGPTQLPTINNGQVLYIINPGPDDVNPIQPWAPTLANGNPNPYFDKELCQEQSMTTAGLYAAPNVVGVPCTVAPAGKKWFSVFDNSKNATNWQLADAAGNKIPLDYKWVRVTLKADNSSPVYVQTPTSAAGGTQVCWDTRSNQQLQLPAGAGTDCLGANTGAAVANITVTNSGAGYNLLTPPKVTISGGGGNGATATANMTLAPQGIASVNGFAGGPLGSGYTSVPSVSFASSTDGAGATFKALVSGSPITAIKVGNANYCYQAGSAPPTVNINPNPSPENINASATVQMTPGTACVASFSATGSCSNQKGNTVTVSSVPGASGSGFSGSITFANKNGGPIQSASIANVGSYTSVNSATQSLTVANGCTVSVNFAGGIQIKSISVPSGGSYLTAPSATLSGPPSPSAPSALQPTLNVSWVAGASNGKITGVQVIAAGTGYAQLSYPLTFSTVAGATPPAAGAVTAIPGTAAVVSSVTVTNGGGGYTSAPTVAFATPPGSGATAKAALAGQQKLLLGQVYMLTAMAMTRSGSQSMVQMEAGVPPPTKVTFQLGGALTLGGSLPDFETPHSAGFPVSGTDADSCGEAVGAPLPAIGVANSDAQYCVLQGGTAPDGTQCPNAHPLGKPANYTGILSTGDVEVNTSSNPTPDQVQQLVQDLSGTAGAVNLPTLPPGPFTPCDPTAAPGTATSCQTFTSLPATTTASVTVVNGNLTLSGNPTGNGILVVTGNLTLQGNFTWNGLILVLGAANASQNGGGNTQITGAVYVASATAGSSAVFNWSGGGGNGIQYDHCLADDLLNNLSPALTDKPLQVLSTRTLEF